MSVLVFLLLVVVVAAVVGSFVRGAMIPHRHSVASAGRPRIAMAKRRSLSRRTAMARRIEARDHGTEMGDWENEGGAVAAAQPIEALAGAPKAP